MRLIALLTLTLLASCATPPMDPAHVELMRQQMALSTLEINCPAGCSVKYRDPDSQLALPQPETWAGTVRDVGMALVSHAPVLGMYGLGIAGFKALEGSGAITHNTDQSTDYSGNEGRIGSSDDYTHDPTMVTQPSPIVVTQPRP